MTTKPAALSAQSTSSPFGSTLHDVRKHLVIRTDLTPQRRRNLLSAINKLCQILDRADHQIPTAMNLLRPLLDNASPGAFLVNPRHWGNIRSSVFAGIKLSGLGVDFLAKDMPINDSWQPIIDRMGHDQQKCFMRRFARFCGSGQIGPAEVDDQVMPQYEAYLNETLSRSPRRSLDDLVRTWNGMVTANPDLQLVQLTRPARSRTYCLPWADLPDSLFADVIAYKATILAANPLVGDGRKKVRTSTANAYERMVRRMATAAIANGAAAEDVSTLAKLVSPVNARRALEFFLARNGGDINQQVHDMAHLALGIAKHWAHLGEHDIAALKEFARRCPIKRHGIAQRNRDRLQQLRDKAMITSLVNLPQRLLDQAQKAEVNCRTAMIVQTAIALAILVCAPIRIGNLRSLDLSRHFKPSFSAAGPVMQLVIPADEVKNEQDLAFPLPPSIKELIDLYFSSYQPLLAEDLESTLLFPGRDGRAKSDNKLRTQIQHAVWSNLGIHVHPHLFRHIAALIFLSKYPGHYEEVRRLLGHKSVETTIRFYAGLETTAAVNRYNEIIEGYRSNREKNKG